MKKGGILLLVLLFLILSGCDRQEREQNQITEIVLLHGWGMGEDVDWIMRDIYQDFEQKNPDIRLKQITAPSWEKVVEKAQEMLAVGKIPDLIFTGGAGEDSLYSFMTEQGYALDLMPYVQQDPDFEQAIYSGVFERWETSTGKLYTVSDALSMNGYWYNQAIFDAAGIEAPPITWEEFMKCCGKIQSWAEKEKLNTVPLHLDPETCLYLMDAYMAGQNQERNDYPLGKNEILFKEASEKIQELKQFADPLVGNSTSLDNISSFNIGHSAICVAEVATERSFNKNLKASYAAFPSVNGQSMGMISVSLGYLVGSTGNKAKEEAGFRFLKYMLSEDVQRRILMETGRIPSNPKVRIEDYQAQCSPRLYLAVSEIKKAKIFYEGPISRWPEVLRKNYLANINQFLQKEITVDEFVEKIQKVQ